MAKVTIVLADNDEGSVEVQAFFDPPTDGLTERKLTPAHILAAELLKRVEYHSAVNGDSDDYSDCFDDDD